MSSTRKIALVTGSGRGIGAAAAVKLFHKGYQVVLCSRSESQLQEVMSSVENSKDHWMHAVPCDLRDINQIRDLYSQIEKDWGYISVLVNNAACIRVKNFIDVTESDWDYVMDLNLKSSFFCAQYAFKQMVANGNGGSIINISSLGGLAGTDKFPGFSTYSMSKFGIVGLTETLAVEGKAHGIRVNCIAPGAVDTQMLKEAAPFLQTNTTPSDIADLILTLSDNSLSGALTGVTIPVYSNVN